MCRGKRQELVRRKKVDVPSKQMSEGRAEAGVEA